MLGNPDAQRRAGRPGQGGGGLALVGSPSPEVSQ